MNSWIAQWIDQMGYLGVALLMFIETVFPPIPSEVIMPVAGLVAARGQMSLPLVITFGTAGAMLGNFVWYAGANWLGIERFRPIIERYGRWLTVDWEEVERARRLFDKHGGGLVFVGRMLPTVRSLVSIPAGLLHMPLLPFLFWSTLGSTIWTGGLATAGYLLGAKFGEIDRYIGPVSTGIIVLLVAYYLYRVVSWRRR